MGGEDGSAWKTWVEDGVAAVRERLGVLAVVVVEDVGAEEERISWLGRGCVGRGCTLCFFFFWLLAL